MRARIIVKSAVLRGAISCSQRAVVRVKESFAVANRPDPPKLSTQGGKPRFTLPLLAKEFDELRRLFGALFFGHGLKPPKENAGTTAGGAR
jgi:hypothetical protein